MSRYFTDQQIDTAVRLANRAPLRKGFAVAERYLRRYSQCTFGVESVNVCGIGQSLRYLNLGDTYDRTVCRYAGEYFAASWGDWLEAQEREYDDDNGTVGCGYCSHHTPIQNDDWRTTVCESCGHCVSGG